MKIGYKIFGSNNLCYGLSLCMYNSGIKADIVTEKTAKYYDVVFFSIFWWEHVYNFYDFCNKAEIGKNKKSKTMVVVGGFNTFNPVLFKKYAHVVFVGDGEKSINNIISGNYDYSCYTGTENLVNYKNEDILNNGFIYYNEQNIARLEVARGCKYRCKFCQLAAIKKYREVSIETIENSVKNIKSKRVVLFAPNRTSHSKHKEIWEILKKYNKYDMCPDVRYNEIDKFFGNNIPQMGIEGISERLRGSVGKPLSNQGFIDLISKITEKRLLDGKKPAVSLGYILDLPTECENDWIEFNNTLDNLQSIKNVDKLVLFFIFNAFQPLPFTKFENESINIDVDYRKKIEKIFKNDRKFKVAIHGKPFGNDKRIMSMICERGGENADLALDRIKRCKWTGLKRVKTIEYILRDFDGIENYINVPKVKPWEIVKIN